MQGLARKKTCKEIQGVLAKSICEDKELGRDFCYLREELVSFAFTDGCITLDLKGKVVSALKKPGEQHPEKGYTSGEQKEDLRQNFSDFLARSTLPLPCQGGHHLTSGIGGVCARGVSLDISRDWGILTRNPTEMDRYLPHQKNYDHVLFRELKKNVCLRHIFFASTNSILFFLLASFYSLINTIIDSIISGKDRKRWTKTDRQNHVHGSNKKCIYSQRGTEKLSLSLWTLNLWSDPYMEHECPIYGSRVALYNFLKRLKRLINSLV